MKYVILLSFLFFGASAFVPAPSSTEVSGGSFNFLRAHRMNRDIMLNWSVNSMSAPVSYRIDRSENDGFSWTTVATPDHSAGNMQRFRDDTVFPGIITYRITAFLEDGSSFVSWNETIRMVVKR